MKWHTSGEFLCTELGGQCYLLPYGQKLADYYAGLKLNETGALLWRALEGGAQEDELLGLLCGHCRAETEEDVLLLRKDLGDFLRQLAARGAVASAGRPQGCFRQGSRARRFFCAGSLRIEYEGPEAVYERYFAEFGCGEGEADQRVVITPGRPPETLNGRVLLRNGELILMEREEGFVMLFSTFQDVYELHVGKDGRECRIYCSPVMSEKEQEDIFHAVRFGFLVLAQDRGLCVVHSASLLYRDRAWLFSGSSGTGKSTHVKLWKDAYGVPLLNGDLNCLGLEGDRVWVYGLPWCGTSGIAVRDAYPLGGVIFLRQWRENTVQELTEAEKACALSMRMITPAWTAGQLDKNLALAEKLAQRCVSARLCCTREPEAAAVMRRYIDCQCERQAGREI